MRASTPPLVLRNHLSMIETSILSPQEQVLSRCNDKSNVLVVDGINKFLDGYFIGSVDWLSIFVFIFLV